MNIVTDASAILEVLLDGDKKDDVLNTTLNSFLLAPSCIDFEIGNALTSLIKRKEISLSESLKVYKEYEKITLRKESVDIREALKIAGANNMYAYDAYYLFCAKKFNAPLLSFDKKLLDVAENMGVVCL